ncbi:MAG TPA: ABC transporter substrate-binding protein [bacterium]|nr:ABC transporter substrate-binding protein [bacterium]
MRRLALSCVVVLTSLALAAGFVHPATAQAQPKLSIMVGGLEKIIYLPAMLTQRLGYFRDAGVDVTLYSEGAGVEAEDEMLAGRVDGVVGFYDHSIDLQSKGKIVEAVIILDRVPGEALVVSNRSGITSLAGLKGKRIGVTGLGSSTNFLANFLVTKGGGGPGGYSPIPVGAGNTLIAAMQQDRIDAAVTTEPTVSRLKKMNLATVLVEMRTAAGTRASLGGTYPAACLYMRADFVASHKDVVQRVVTAFVRTLKYLQATRAPDVAAQMPEDYYVGDKPLYLAALGASMGMFNPTGAMPTDGPPTVLKVLATFNKELDPTKIDLAKTYTDEFVNAALAAK